jgi:hypothetical protein
LLRTVRRQNTSFQHGKGKHGVGLIRQEVTEKRGMD